MLLFLGILGFITLGFTILCWHLYLSTDDIWYLKYTCIYSILTISMVIIILFCAP